MPVDVARSPGKAGLTLERLTTLKGITPPTHLRWIPLPHPPATARTRLPALNSRALGPLAVTVPAPRPWFSRMRKRIHGTQKGARRAQPSMPQGTSQSSIKRQNLASMFRDLGLVA
jgi:hypothetical protein